MVGGFRYGPPRGTSPRLTRVSTLEQDLTLQHDALTAAGCYRIYTDRISGSLEKRPELDKVLDQLRPGDTLVVWRLDRLGRSIRH
jgi:DNA invertase Pin-like site-specific DNA recombinase